MEARKTAAIVLSIIALIAILYTVILPEMRLHQTQTISFKSCKENFESGDKGYVSNVERISQNKLALCLCDLYKKEPDESVAKKILQIYKINGSNGQTDSTIVNLSIDSLIKNKSMAFDTLMLVD